MFVAALFTIAKLQNQPSYPTTYQWIKKYGIYMLCNITQAQKNEIMTFVGNMNETGTITLRLMR
jgi:hypothetical protein